MSGEYISKQVAVERLAEALYETMERLDPSESYLKWADLPEFNKVFYVACIHSLLDSENELRAALSENDHVVGRSAIAE